MPNADLIFTLNDIKQAALPLGTRVLSGAERLRTPVRWVEIVSPEAPLPFLEGGELLLLYPTHASEAWMMTTIQSGAAGIITPDALPALALSAAQLAGFPVFLLPAGSQLREVERAILTVLLNRQADLERRSVGIYQQLMRMASDNADLNAIVHELSRMVDKAVILQDKRLRIHESSLPPALSGAFESIRKPLEDKDGLPNAFQDRHKLPLSTTPVLLQALNIDGLSRLITPIVTQGIGRGYFSFVAPTETFSDLDSLVLQHAAVICAMEMARAKAMNETEKRLRGDFLDTLMLGNVSDSEAVVEGDRYGHDMTVPHAAMVVQWQGKQHPSPRRLETLVNGLSGRYPNSIISRMREDEVRLFYKVEGANPVQMARELANELYRDARREYPDARLAIGIGAVAARAIGWRQSYKEAVQAVELAQKLKADTPLFIGDLGVYMFLSKPDYREELIALRDSTIGNLISYEERQRADLLQTLNAFFEAHGNHTATADALNVHRNTLTYRMNRIAEITGLDMNQPDVRLAVHLALKIQRLMGNEG